ncbi:MAG: hypothetical protein SFV23_24295 [Planctomycetaceae bacterium]|nr:hypothetical protein [Planctomycetaceae bacterium]
MAVWFEHLAGAWGRCSAWLVSPRGSAITVVLLLATQAGLLAYSATRHSPTFLEPAFLASGISHWQFGRFELYRVNRKVCGGNRTWKGAQAQAILTSVLATAAQHARDLLPLLSRARTETEPVLAFAAGR